MPLIVDPTRRRLFLNNTASILTASVTDTDTTLSISNDEGIATGFDGDLPSGDGQTLDLTLTDGTNIEIVSATSMTTGANYEASVERGQQGTLARAWPAGTRIEARLTADAMREAAPSVGEVTMSYGPPGDKYLLLAGGTYVAADFPDLDDVLVAAGETSGTLPDLSALTGSYNFQYYIRALK
jgi:hypothetical protein